MGDRRVQETKEGAKAIASASKGIQPNNRQRQTRLEPNREIQRNCKENPIKSHIFYKFYAFFKANDQWNEESLIRCEFCNRTFLENRMPGHRKICTAEKPFKPLPKAQEHHENSGNSGNFSGKNEFSAQQASKISTNSSNHNNPSNNYSSSSQKTATFSTNTGQKPGGFPAKPANNYQKNEFEDVPLSKSNKKFSENPAQFEEFNENIDLITCQICERNFASDRIKKHLEICAKAQAKGKKHEQAVAKANTKLEKQEKTAQKIKSSKASAGAKWKKQHEELVEAMKYMRQVKQCEEQGGDFSKIKPPASSNYDDYVECPYCSRKYNPDVAQRHIPKCKDIINKPAPVKKPSSLTNSPYKASPQQVKSTKVSMGTPQKTVGSKNNSSNFAGFGGNANVYGGNANVYGGNANANAFGGNSHFSSGVGNQYGGQQYGNSGNKAGNQKGFQGGSGFGVQGAAFSSGKARKY